MINTKTLWLPITKSDSGELVGILSDNCVDRDDEIISKELLMKWASNPNQYLPALIDHKNEVFSLVGEWRDAKVVSSVEDADRYALTVKPKFYESNPNATVVKNMIGKDDAKIGLSIGAIPAKDGLVDIEIDGKKYKMWVDAELVEGSFTPIPSNRNAMILAKSFGVKPVEANKEIDDKMVGKEEVEQEEKPVEESEEEEEAPEKEEEKTPELEEVKSLISSLIKDFKSFKEKVEEDEEEEEDVEKSVPKRKFRAENKTVANKPRTKEVYGLEDFQKALGGIR